MLLWLKKFEIIMAHMIILSIDRVVMNIIHRQRLFVVPFQLAVFSGTNDPCVAWVMDMGFALFH